LQTIPGINWKKASDIIKYEGLYIFGGVLANGNINEKLKILCFVPKDRRSERIEYKLEFKSQEELELKPTGRPPQGRYDHGMLKFSNSLVVFGGRKLNRESPFSDSVYMLKLDTMIWTKVKQN